MSSRLYNTDFFTWSHKQALLLRTGQLSKIDADLLAEEIEDMGNEIRNACFSFITHILEHLLKLNYSSGTATNKHWRREIINFRVELDRRLTKSIEHQIDLSKLYRQAVRLAMAKLDKPGFAKRLPENCPWTLEQVRDEDYWPEHET